MIRVTASPDGEIWTVFEHAPANGWRNDENRNLDITTPTGDVVATYRAGTWFRVWEDVPADDEATDDANVREHTEAQRANTPPDLLNPITNTRNG
jgi:hypothetical protein